jgi:hypothetical protein
MSYIVWNGPAPTTAAQASAALANGVKTLLQLATPSDMQIRLEGWGYSIDASPAGITVMELIQTDVAATVTAHVNAGIINYDPNGPTHRLTLGTSATGYTATVEGSTTASRVFQAKEIIASATGSTLSYDWVWPYGTGPIVAVSKFLRVRSTSTSTTPKALSYVVFSQL